MVGIVLLISLISFFCSLWSSLISLFCYILNVLLQLWQLLYVFEYSFNIFDLILWSLWYYSLIPLISHRFFFTMGTSAAGMYLIFFWSLWSYSLISLIPNRLFVQWKLVQLVWDLIFFWSLWCNPLISFICYKLYLQWKLVQLLIFWLMHSQTQEVKKHFKEAPIYFSKMSFLGLAYFTLLGWEPRPFYTKK